MPVYFVYRSPYDSPSGKRLARFEDDTLLAWFRRHWPTIAKGDVGDLLGFGVYGFGSLFGSDIEEIPPMPETDEQLAEYIQDNLYSEGPILTSPHLITVQTDDDELMVAYYIFDGHYLRSRFGKRAAFLVQEGWKLPGGSASGPFRPSEPTSDEGPAGRGKGALYWTCEAWEDSCNLLDRGPAVRLKGVRVADLARYLARNEPSESWSSYWSLLRTQLLAEGATSDPLEERFREALLDDPDDEATWGAYSDWLQERGLPPAGLVVLECALRGVLRYLGPGLPDNAWGAVREGSVRQARAALESALAAHKPKRRSTHNPAKSLLHVEEHMAQLCIHVARWDKVDVYQQWIFFDDRWGAAHPDLANSILRWHRCWDMLSPDGPHDNDED
jgi:uncharacterized protein (TIGR02996 family)